jgi:glycosyltransferase involved in cell wall biosynthesis
MATSVANSRPLVAVFDLITSVGGVQKVMAGVLPALAKEFRVVVIDPYGNPDYIAMMQGLGIQVETLGRPPKRHYVGGMATPWRPFYLAARLPWMLRTAWRLRRWVRQNRPAVIYFNQASAACSFGRLLPWRGPALIYHAHGFRSAKHVGSRFARFLSRRFDRVMAVSRITADFLIQASMDPGKVEVVYNAVDTERIRREAVAEGPALPPRPADVVVFLHVAVIAPYKAQYLGIEALAKLPVEWNAHLWICGDVGEGGDRAYLAGLHRLVDERGLSGRVHFLGWRRDVPRVMNAADVVLLPSLYHSESFGMVLAEAMALGKPCIGSNRGGVPEVIEDGMTGIVCEPDVESLAAAFSQMAESKDRREAMGRAGRERVENLFGLGRQVEEIARVLRSAARGGKEKP